MNRATLIEWLIRNPSSPSHQDKREDLDSWPDNRLLNAYRYRLESNPSRTPLRPISSTPLRHRARVTVNGIGYYLGSFATKDEADEAVFRFKIGLTH